MKLVLKGLIFVLCCSVLTACALKQQTYYDPQYHKAGYEAIKQSGQPIPAKVQAQFQRNGEPLPAANAELLGHVERTLRASGVFLPTTDQSVATSITVTANNIADMDAARSKGFKTGFTFGGSGSVIDDNYEFTLLYRNADGKERKSTYQHAIHTAMGNVEPLKGMTPTTITDAFGRVVEDVVLNFIKDLQDAGLAKK